MNLQSSLPLKMGFITLHRLGNERYVIYVLTFFHYIKTLSAQSLKRKRKARKERRKSGGIGA